MKINIHRGVRPHPIANLGAVNPQVFCIYPGPAVKSYTSQGCMTIPVYGDGMVRTSGFKIPAKEKK